MTGPAGSLPQWEQDKIFAACDGYGIDPTFVAAIRLSENGGPGREFGVLSISAPTYDLQLDATCRTVVHRLTDYETKRGVPAIDPDGRYSADFLDYFGGIWAPIGAGNDPRGLNQFWVANVRSAYDTSGVA